jgi:hypothetical protein
VELEGVGATRSGTELIRDGTGSLAFSLDSLAVTSFRSQLLGRPFELRATVREFEDPRISARVTAAIDLAQLAALRGGAVPAEGLISADLQLDGPVRRPAEIGVVGPVNLSNVRYSSSALAVPVIIPSGTVRFATRTVRIEELPIELGQSDLRISLTGRDLVPLALRAAPEGPAPTIEFRATSNRLDWGEILPVEADTALGYADLVTARLAGRQVGGRDPAELARERYRPPPLPPIQATGDVRIAELRSPPNVARDVALRIVLRDGRLELRDLTGKFYDGDLTGSMTVDLARGEPPFPLSYVFSLQGGQAGPFVRRWTRLGSVISGAIDLRVEGNTALDESLLPVPGATDASGRSLVRDGRFEGFGLVSRVAQELKLQSDLVSSFRSFGGPFRIEGGTLRLEEWQMLAPNATVGITGSAGLGGTLDLRLSMDVPAATLRESRLIREAGLGDIAQALLGRRENLQISAGVVGTMTDPVVQIDMEALQQQFRGGAEDAIRRLFRRPPEE